MLGLVTDRVLTRCPRCGTEVREGVEDGKDIVCVGCGRGWRVVLDKATGSVGFIASSAREVPEPLFLPRGSIRAAVAVLLAFCTMVVAGSGHDIPDQILALHLTIIGYYFAFRRQAANAAGRILDASTTHESPLFLPSGVIRVLLIAAFVFCAIFLHKSDRLVRPKYAEFFLLLGGLVAGSMFAKVFAKSEGRPFYTAINHLKGAAVLCAALWLCWLLLSGTYAQQAWPPLLAACFVSFYLGSR
ncbi:MAG: hypothetical protein RDV41_13500 [Planctomycetota bacterium]|nr:hypothetical protein [Planctomycetota bacterium]